MVQKSSAMKKILCFFALCAAMLTGVSCKPAPSLTVSPSSCEFNSNGGQQEINVTANYTWTATSSANWVKVETPIGTKDDIILRFSVANNNQPDSREAVITVTCEDVVQTIKVIQGQKNTVIPVTGDDLSFPWEAGTVTLEMSSNVDYVTGVNSSEEWIRVVSTKGLTASSVTLSLDENDSFTARNATITFSYEGEVLKQVYITQEGKPQTLVVVHNTKSFKAPVIFGFGMNGTIAWGDGSLGKYNSALTHSYVTNGPFEVRIEATQASTASLNDFVGVEKVDLSGF